MDHDKILKIENSILSLKKLCELEGWDYNNTRVAYWRYKKKTNRLKSGVTEKVTEDVTKNVTENVIENVTENVTEGVTANVTKRVTIFTVNKVTKKLALVMNYDLLIAWLKDRKDLPYADVLLDRLEGNRKRDRSLIKALLNLQKIFLEDLLKNLD